MKRSEVFEVVKSTLINTLGIEEDMEIRLNSKLIDDLGAESLDLLDIMARLERRFEIALEQEEESGVEKFIREKASEEELETGIIPDEVLKELPTLMPEVDPSEFSEGLTFNDLPKLYTVYSLVYGVENALKDQKEIEVENDMN